MNNMLSLNCPPIILASNSPRRKELLELIDLPFKAISSSVHEDFNIDLKPIEFVKHYAKLKALDIAKDFQDHLVIGADTVVVLNDEIIGKPIDENNSKSILGKLSGKTHTVITGVALVWLEKNVTDIFNEITNVTFRRLTDEQIQYYIDNYHPFDKAGSYGIQDWFAVCVKRIDGCFYNVMGMPLSNFYKHFTEIIK
ncbi:MAG: Maf family protein [Candidatus Neomarinimicrobiota bacterium]